jgi:hypothetical protein
MVAEYSEYLHEFTVVDKSGKYFGNGFGLRANLPEGRKIEGIWINTQWCMVMRICSLGGRYTGCILNAETVHLSGKTVYSGGC